MATIVVMPQLGNSVESCLIVNWLVAEGDAVAEGQILCEVETDKASMEVPSTGTGTLLKRLWAEGDDVPVKDPLVVLGEPGEDPAPALAEAGWGGAGAVPAEAAPVAEAAAPAAAAPAATPAAAASAAQGTSPRARNLAAANSLDIAAVAEGTGPGGRVIERDVKSALADATRGAARAGAHGAGAVGTGLGGRVSTADLTATAAPASTRACRRARR